MVVGFSLGMLCLYRSDSKRDASRRSVVELLNGGCTSLTSVFPITRFNILFSEVEVSCLKRTIISAESSCESKMKVYKMGVSSPALASPRPPTLDPVPPQMINNINIGT